MGSVGRATTWGLFHRNQLILLNVNSMPNLYTINGAGGGENAKKRWCDNLHKIVTDD